MRWKGRRQSRNIQDRRGMRGGPKMAAGGGVGFIILIVVVILLGGNPQQLLNQMPASAPQGSGSGGGGAVVDPAEEELAAFVSVVLADTEVVWGELLGARGIRYEEPTLVMFRDRVRSACGMAIAASGPFYCPGDSQIYIDLSFYEELSERFSAPGDFAQAYVIAHEVGHHLQHLMGISDRVHAQRGRVSDAEYNDLSVRLELQADYLAGVWAHHAQKKYDMLEAGDIEEALRAAAAIGDDRIQMQSQGYVVPDSFTHGTSDQRVRWFRRGFESGDLDQGDTFSARDL